MSRFGILYKNYKWVLRPNFHNINLFSDINRSSRRISTNTSCIHNVIERDEHENEIYHHHELNISKMKNLKDFVNTVDKFQKAKLEDINKMLVTAQRFQAYQQRSTDSHYDLSFNLEDLNKVDLSNVDQIPKPIIDSNLPLLDIPNISIFKKKLKKTEKIEHEQEKSIPNSTISRKSESTSNKEDFTNLLPHSDNDYVETAKAKMHDKIRCYVELCIANGMLKRAFNLLTNYYLKSKSNQSNLSDCTKNVGLYVILMDAFAKQGNQEALKKLYSQIVDMQMTPNMGIFAALFECLGRADKLNVGLAKYFLSEVQRHNLKMEDIFSERIYIPLEQKYVLKAVSPLLPNLVVKPKTMNHDYDCNIMNHLNNPSPFRNSIANFMKKEDMNDKLEKMLEMEIADQVIVKSIIHEKGSLSAREKLNFYQNHWKQNLFKNFNSMIGFMELNGNQLNSGISLFPFMKLFKPEDYVDIMMQEIDHMGEDLSGYCPPTHVLHESLGFKVYNKFKIQTKGKNLNSFLPVYMEYLDKISKDDLSANHRTIWNTIALSKSYNPITLQKWSYPRRKEIGKMLYDIIMSSIKVEKPTDKMSDIDPYQWNIPAFYTKRIPNENNTFSEEVVAHPLMKNLYEQAETSEYKFPSYELPMLVPPVPWNNLDNGASLLNSVDLIRHVDMNLDMINLLKSHQPEKIYPMLDSLNALGACPWRVNTWVLDHIVNVFKQGGSKALHIPMRYPEMRKVEIHSDMSAEEAKCTRNHNKKVDKIKKEYYSIWITENYRLSIANKYRDVPMFWFSHNVDFRGRTYPMQPHFNHYGNDLGRSLLQFGIGKPLGPNGLDWLKIHLVNLTGLQKRCTNVDKLAFANESMELILDSADNPFEEGNVKWWQTCDKPWQTLASCKEVADAIRSPDPEKFISYLPVHQDGSCNGLQHYAALGRDEKGAKSVNLSPSIIPQDVYSDVVEIIEEIRSNEAEKVEIARTLKGFVTRKVVKQTIMTYVYGVTTSGARDQIKGQLQKIDEFPQIHIEEASSYLAKKIFESLGSLFTAAKEIKEWFDKTSSLIAEHKKVSWETPIGWPVIQPYVKVVPESEKKDTKNKSNLHTLNRIIPHKRRQKSAFSPNFIHSLDAAHMTLTAINCHSSGVVFNAVHDCFWTHACDTDQMNRICREQFIALHGEPLLEILSEHYLRNFGFKDTLISVAKCKEARSMTKANASFQNIPKKGHFDLKQVKDSTYFFS